MEGAAAGGGEETGLAWKGSQRWPSPGGRGWTCGAENRRREGQPERLWGGVRGPTPPQARPAGKAGRTQTAAAVGICGSRLGATLSPAGTSGRAREPPGQQRSRARGGAEPHAPLTLAEALGPPPALGCGKGAQGHPAGLPLARLGRAGPPAGRRVRGAGTATARNPAGTPSGAKSGGNRTLPARPAEAARGEQAWGGPWRRGRLPSLRLPPAAETPPACPLREWP